MAVSPDQAQTLAYVLRLWRAALQHIRAARRCGYAGLDGAWRFLRARIERASVGQSGEAAVRDRSPPGAAASVLYALSRGVCSLATPVEVARVEMRGDTAWVEVVRPQTSVRQVRFYRRTPQGWLHTAPQARFWRDPVDLASGRVLVRAHRRDLPHIEPQVAYIAKAVDDVCMTLDCPADVGLEVHFSHHDGPPRLSGTVLTLASPWLVGIAADGLQDEGYTRALTYWTVYGVVSQVVRYDRDVLWWHGAFPPDAACKEMLHACASRYSHSGQYSADVLPEMLGAMRDTGIQQGFGTY